MTVWYDPTVDRIYIVHGYQWTPKELRYVVACMHPTYFYIGEFD